MSTHDAALEALESLDDDADGELAIPYDLLEYARRIATSPAGVATSRDVNLPPDCDVPSPLMPSITLKRAVLDVERLALVSSYSERLAETV